MHCQGSVVAQNDCTPGPYTHRSAAVVVTCVFCTLSHHCRFDCILLFLLFYLRVRWKSESRKVFVPLELVEVIYRFGGNRLMQCLAWVSLSCNLSCGSSVDAGDELQTKGAVGTSYVASLVGFAQTARCS